MSTLKDPADIFRGGNLLGSSSCYYPGFHLHAYTPLFASIKGRNQASDEMHASVDVATRMLQEPTAVKEEQRSTLKELCNA